jgi:cytochrome P450
VGDAVLTCRRQFLDLTGTFLVGERFQRSENSGSRNKEIVSPQDFLRAFHAAGFWVAIRITFGWIGMNWPSSSFRDNCQMMHRFVDHYVTAALERASDATSPSNPNPRKVGSTCEQNPRSPLLDAATNANFVSSLVQQSSKTYEIRSQVLQIMLASQDVIATLLSNCIFLLSRHHNAWHKLRQEVLAHGSNERLSASTLAQLPYLQNIIKEGTARIPRTLTTFWTGSC